MLAAAAATWRRTNPRIPASPAELARRSWPPLRLARDLLAGALIGMMTGFFEVGAGFFIVPALAIGLALSRRLAVGTSLVIIGATSLMALTAHLAGRTLNFPITAAVSAEASPERSHADDSRDASRNGSSPPASQPSSRSWPPTC